ncbi:MAG: hypothetical protein Q7S00_04035, partial [bacterium]|nr:hypothetical protein [bacterium]
IMVLAILVLAIGGTVDRFSGGPFTTARIEGMSAFGQAAAYTAIGSWTVGAIAVAVFLLAVLGVAVERFHFFVKKFGALRLPISWL